MELDFRPLLVDSSVWVALFLDADTNHKKAAEIFDAITHRVYVPYIVLAEVATTLAYKHSKPQADGFLRYVSSDERFSLVDNRHAADVPAFLNFTEKISFADVAIIQAAISFEAILVTFDKQMKRLYGHGIEAMK